jgi:hypothetical protein
MQSTAMRTGGGEVDGTGATRENQQVLLNKLNEMQHRAGHGLLI